MTAALNWYRLKHTDARVDPRIQGEWSIADYNGGVGVGEDGEFCLLLIQNVGLQVRAFTDSRRALERFFALGAFQAGDEPKSRFEVEAMLVGCGISEAAQR